MATCIDNEIGQEDNFSESGRSPRRRSKYLRRATSVGAQVKNNLDEHMFKTCIAHNSKDFLNINFDQAKEQPL